MVMWPVCAAYCGAPDTAATDLQDAYAEKHYTAGGTGDAPHL